MKPLASVLAGLFIALNLAGCPLAGPSADFIASPTEGDAPLSVRFTDLSEPGSAAIESWRWDFGDGTDSADENPVHLYPDQGTYRVTLTVSSIFGSTSETKNAYITVRAAPVASFSATPRAGNTPLAVQFLDESDGGPFAITARQWTFGDGETSEEEDPLHVYEQPGAYTVALTVTAEGGTDTETRQGYIQVGALPAASFRATPATGAAPLEVQFTDLSAPGGSPIESWQWTFGDGTAGVEQNPQHRYEAPGVYTVALTVRNAAGEVTSTRTGLIRATEGPVAAFRAAPIQGAAPLATNFTDESQPGTSPIASWLWDFGDGTSSVQRNPTHEFATAGQYDITLTVETDAGTDTLLKEKYITSLAPPGAGFSATPTRGPAPLSVEFRDGSTAGASSITTRQWSFGDAAFSGETNPVHVYTAPGRYPVSLTVQSAVGSSTLNREGFIEVVALPTASFEATPTSGESPLSVTFTDTSAPGTQPITAWLWEFGDGTTSTAQNPTRVYTGTGEYTVTLTATTAEGANTATRAQFIRVFERADANFTAEPVAGSAPLSVQFRNASDPGSVGIDGRSWDFGDGSTSAVEDPLHVYAEPGTYTVSLVLATPSGPDSERKPAFIRVNPAVTFTRAPATGVVPATVVFTDTTVASPLTASAWSWNFGDDGTSTLENPSHSYTKAGIYDVTLAITTEQGDATATQTTSVQLRPKPAFTGTPLSATGAPLAVQFQDATDPGNLSISGWDWNFGDGSHSTIQHPEHAFAKPGVYDVALTVTTALGNSTTVKADYVVVRPAAAFSATPATGEDTLLVQFTDQTDPGHLEVLTWDWNFGDGATSRLQSPAHLYAGPGTYTVTLTAGSTQGADTETKIGLIAVTPEVTFAGSVTSGTAPLDVAFTDTTNTGTLETTARSWDFGEGEPGDEAAPVHTYAEPGLYDVALAITTAQGEATGARAAYIEVVPALVATAAITPGSGTSSVVFTNGSDTGNLTGVSWFWNFGDGSTSAAASPTHVFAEPGIYVVTLALTSAEGVTTTQTMATIEVLPVVSFTATPENGVAPLDVLFANTSNVGSLAVTGVLWDFGDGNTSTDPNPQYTYGTAGTFPATLTLTTALGNATSAAPASIEVSPEPNFSGTPRSGPAPLAVVFSNTSSTGGATVTGTNWDFGDGTSSTAATPTHTYTVPGTYTVSFVLTTTEGTESATKTDYIEVNPIPAFTADTASGGVPLTVNFANTTVLGNVLPTGYAWDFGDGGTSTDESPAHTYTLAGVYPVRLTITSSQGSVSTTQAGLIAVEPVVEFTASAPSGPAPLAVTFTDATVAGNLDVTDWTWDFDDGSAPVTTQTGTVTHTYTIPGNYTPTLTLVTPDGNFTDALGSEIVVNPVPAISADLRSGPGVLTAVFSDDTDTGNVTTSNRTWNWGDGTANTTTNNTTAGHTFAAPGLYDVSLTINTATQGSFTAAEPDFITVNTLTFTVTGGLSGSAPHTISVTNTTAAGDLAITGTQWDYGDGTGQTASTSHSYTTPGTYLTSMIAATAQGNRSVTATVPVVVSPVIAYGADVTSGPAVVDVTFTDSTPIGGITVNSRTWTFGDGSSVTIPAPTATVSHQYTNTGTLALVRAATLTLNTTIGTFPSPSPVNITIHPINFSGDTTNLDAPLLVNFTDLTSTGALTITSRAWDFKDGSSASTAGNATSRTYTEAGSYDVELTVTTSQGNTATANLVTPILVRPVVQYFETSPTFGPTSLTVSFEDQTDTGNLTGVSRRWTWGDGTATTLSGTATSHTFSAAGCYSVTMELLSDEGTFSNNSMAIDITADESRSLTMSTTANNGQAGIMFDLEALIDLEIDSFTLNFSASGSGVAVRHYANILSSLGLEGTTAGWTLLDQITVTTGAPTVLDFNDLAMPQGQRRGMYLLNRAGSPNIRYQNSVPDNAGLAVSDGRLRLYTNAGKSVGSANDFDGATFANRWYVGSIQYHYDVVCNAKSGGLQVQSAPATLEFGKGGAKGATPVSVEDAARSARMPDKGWAAIGYQSISGVESETPLLIRTDAALDLLWELDLGAFALDEVSGLRALADGDLVLWGSTSLGGAAGELLLLRLDGSGAMRWEQVIEGCPAADAVAMANGPEGGTLLLAGRSDGPELEVPVVYAIDAFSNILWRAELPPCANRVNWGLSLGTDEMTLVYGSLGDETDDGTVWEVRLDGRGEVLNQSGRE